MDGGIIVSFYDGDIVTLFRQNDDGVRISDPDIVTHPNVIKRGVGLIWLFRAEYRVAQFRGEAVAAVTISKSR